MKYTGKTQDLYFHIFVARQHAVHDLYTLNRLSFSRIH